MVQLLLGVGVLLAILASLCIGIYPMSFWHAARIVAHLAWPPLPANPLWTVKEIIVIQVIRLPRVLMATLVGLGLGVSGTSLQGIIRNPLVSPDIVAASARALPLAECWPCSGTSRLRASLRWHAAAGLWRYLHLRPCKGLSRR